MAFYQRGQVRIHYEEVGSGFPLLVIPGGGLNSTVAGLATHPFNPFDEFKGEFRVIAADLRNAKGGQSSGPLEVDRPWGAYSRPHDGPRASRRATKAMRHHRRSDPGGESDRSRRQSCHPAETARAADQVLPLHQPGHGR
jgi:pimeloyl-ACP methyl ester carboxylesterase